MGTKNEGDRCYDAALADEPMFVLLARDPSAASLVRQWAGARRCDIVAGLRPHTDLPQVEEAERLADRMVAWRADADEAWRKQPQLAFPPVSDGTTLDTFGQDVDQLQAFHDAVVFGQGATLDGKYVPFPNERDPLAGQHLAARQGDEYFCSRCSKRWAVDEDAPEACTDAPHSPDFRSGGYELGN